MNLKTLIEQRNKAAVAARAVLDRAAAESRALTADEEQSYDRAMEDVSRLGRDIDRRLALVAEEERAAAAVAEVERRERAEEELRRREGGGGGSALPPAAAGEDERRGGLQMVAFRGWLRTNRIAGEGADELRALQADADTAGGYLVPPPQFVQELIKAVDDQTFVRRYATQYQSATGLGAVSLDADPDDFDWTSELATGSEDSSMAFGRRALGVHPLAKRVKVSKTLMRLTNADTIVRDRLGYKLAVTQEKAYLTGNGSGRPLGVFTASTQGISTARDVSTDNTATAITADGLKNAKYALKPQYWPRARWMFHRDAVKQIAKLKDGNGQYLWQPGLQAGQPDRLENLPIDVSEFAPNTFSSGQYVGILADWSKYWINDSPALTLQRLLELYAETNQDGFIARYEGDGMPVLEEAFVRVKLG